MEAAVRRRTAAKSWLSRTDGKLKELLEKPTHEVTETELAFHLTQFEDKLASFDATQIQVEETIDEASLEEDIVASADFRESKVINYLILKDRCDSRSRDRAREQLADEGGSRSSYGENSGDSGSVTGTTIRPRSCANNTTRLPKLELPKFKGDFTQWQSFWDKFTTIVHHSDLPPVNKFTYLQSLLQGEALAVIEGLALTEANYETACKILQRRFGRKERIIFGHIQRMLAVSSTPVKDSLWKLHDEIQTQVRSLSNLGIDGSTYGVILTPLILHQLPTNIRLEWARVGEGREADLDFLLNFLFEEICRRERSQTFSTLSPSENLHPIEKNRRSSTTRPTASTLFTNTNTSDPTPEGDNPDRHRFRSKCAICAGGHFPDKCQNILDLSLQERKEKLRRLGLCFICLGPHLAKDCVRKCYFCKGKHHMILCDRKNVRYNREQAQPVPSVETDIKLPYMGMAYSKCENKNTVMQIVKTKIMGKEVSIMFDSGADRSFVSSTCAKKLNLASIGTEDITYSCFGEEEPSQNRKLKHLFELKVWGLNLKLIEIPSICSLMYRSPIPEDILNEFEHIYFAEDFSKGQDIRVDLLIGLDHYWDLMGTNQVRSSSGLVAQETAFGWMLSGFWSEKFKGKHPLRDGTFGSQNVVAMRCQTQLSEHTIRQMWDLDSIGIRENQESKTGTDTFLDEFKKEIKLAEGRYEVKLPWKSESHKQILMKNEVQAERRLKNLSRKLSKDEPLRVRYDAALLELEREGIIHKIPAEELETGNPVFYLPHRPVVREGSSSTKVRPVFDASAKGENGLSLNDCLETGPNLIPDLIQVLLRFRRWRFGLTADIRKAFLQIKLRKEEQDVHRFLWDLNGKVETMRFERVTFGNAASPFLLNVTIKHHLENFPESRVRTELLENLYVDDWLTGADSPEEIMGMIQEAEGIMIKGGFPLTKWGSNCSSLSQYPSKEFEMESGTTLAPRKILGISWNTEEDCLCFATLDIGLDQHLLLTKRLLLSVIARLFDPLGFLTPFTITLKILFQEVWRMGLEWDQILPTEIQGEVSKWIFGLDKIKTWKIPRCLSTQAWQDVKNQKVELITFSDASEKAYGCCMYLKVTGKGKEPTVTLIMSKVRVAPLKRVTLPRLELLGALLSARLLDFCRTSIGLPVDCHYSCWTDSKITLDWIKSEPHRWKQFVCNRVTEIQELTCTMNWKHCPGKDNPADLLTRGIDSTKFISSRLWMHGPEWLIDTNTTRETDKDEHESEPVRQAEGSKLGEMEMELKKPTKPEDDIVVLTSTKTCIDSVMDFSRFGEFHKLLRAVGWILRFIQNVRNPLERISAKNLLSEELNHARLMIIKWTQGKAYQAEIKDLQKNGFVNRKSSIASLSPFLGADGLIRIHGRLEQAPSLLYDEKHPILLPKCHISSLLVRSHHEMLKHAGLNTLITALRNKYWIVSVRTLAKKVCRHCLRCQRQDARTLAQTPAPLPKDRVTKMPPFSVVGVDHAGPLFCSDTGDQKLYILIFTCAVTRGVHLELVNSLKLEDFLLAFRRFSSRRGIPTVIYSDNARTFKGASRSIQNELGHVTTVWKFNAPLAPWWGGWWERLIRSTKSALRKTLGRSCVTRTQLETVLHEVEACINSRPLTYVEETKQPLTPSHFLIGRGTPMVSAEMCDFNEDFVDLNLRKTDQETEVDKFWDTWNDDYLRNLPPLRLKRSSNDLRIGSMVLIREENKPRLQWPLGLIIKLYPGRDGLVRAVQLRTGKGVMTRAVQKLCKLELNGDLEDNENEDLLPCSPSIEVSDLTDHQSKAKVENPFRTKRGRLIKPRQTLDL